jgi:hypothetical protein
MGVPRIDMGEDPTVRLKGSYAAELAALAEAYGPDRVEMSDVRVIHVRWPGFGLEFAGPAGRALPTANCRRPWSVTLYDSDGTTTETTDACPDIHAAITAGFALIDNYDLDAAAAHAEDLQDLSERSER